MNRINRPVAVLLYPDEDESTTHLVVADASPWGYGNDYSITATVSGWERDRYG